MRSAVRFTSPFCQNPHILDRVSVSACVRIDEIHTELIDGQVLIARVVHGPGRPAGHPRAAGQVLRAAVYLSTRRPYGKSN